MSQPPLAISKLIAARRVHGKNQDVQRVFQAGLLFGLVAGGLMTTILLFGADWITVHIFNSPNSALPLKVMAPTILVFSVMGVVRGYFQGLGNMVPTSISQVIEQVVNAIISVAASSPSCTGSRTGKLRRLTVLQAVLWVHFPVHWLPSCSWLF